MAKMIKCSCCSEKMAHDALVCPHCGKQTKVLKQDVFGCVLIFVVYFILQFII